MRELSWSLALDLWTQAILPHLVQGGACSNKFWGAKPEDRLRPDQLLAKTMFDVLAQKKYCGLLAKDFRRQEQQRVPGLKDVTIHTLHEVETYIKVMFRRITLTSQNPKKTARPDLTNAHRLLLLLLPYVSKTWSNAQLIRLPETPTQIISTQDDLLVRLADFLQTLSDYEKKRGYGANSVSQSWISPKTGKRKDGTVGFIHDRPPGSWGGLHLVINEMQIPVPEEMSIADVFNCLPGILNNALQQEWSEGMENADTDAHVDGNDGSDTEEGQVNTISGSGGYRIWTLFRRMIENLNDPYGKMYKAGLPSALMFDFENNCKQKYSYDELGTLVSLRIAAQGIAKARRTTVVTLAEWEQAWIDLKLMGDLKGRYQQESFGGFQGFLSSEEGKSLLSINDFHIVGEEDEDAELTGGVILDDSHQVYINHKAEHREERATDFYAQLKAWRNDRSMTVSELLLLEFGGVAEKADVASADPDLIRLCAREEPYRLLPDAKNQQAVLRYFCQRRYCQLMGFGCTPRKDGKGWKRVLLAQGSHPLTEAEQITLDMVRKMNDEAGYPDRNHSGSLQVKILAGLKTSSRLQRALSRFPYALAPEAARLRLMLFFYTRDVESFLSRPV